VALVTGGGRGLGRVIAQELAAAGAAVAVVARSADQLQATVTSIREAGGNVMALPADVTDQTAMEEIVDAVERQLGPMTLLVNNAAIVSPLGPMWESDADQWWRTLEVNLRGPMLGIRAAAPRMIQWGQGRIVNVASRAALNAIAYGSAYVASKTALVRLTENLALEIGAYGITVFAIDPGNVRTAMTEYLADSPAGKRWTPWFRSIFDEDQDVSPDLVAHLVRRIAAGHADALTGRFISVFDDLDALVEREQAGAQEDLHTLRLQT
jgi:NAD(P)-dependent dehydrogenase (short-subunit alcohol dehydrogenase family)